MLDEKDVDERELRIYAYRMLGGWQDAEDAVQEARLKAWRAAETYDDRGTFRAWVYRILTHTCLDMLRARGRRVLPQDVGPSVGPGPPSTAIRTDIPWLEPYPDTELPDVADPESAARLRSSVRLAWIRAVQVLPARQRAALILHDVLDWSANETAEILETSTAAVNSLLQRARATLTTDTLPTRAQEADALGRLVRAWETGDFADLVSILAEDARMDMPPWVYWLDGRAAIVACVQHPGTWGGEVRAGRYRMVPTAMNGQPAALAYVPGDDGRWVAVCLTVLGLDGEGRISQLTVFVLPELFVTWGFPAILETPAG